MHPGGLRFGTSETTRLGMEKDDMIEIANLLENVIIDGKPLDQIRERVIEFRKRFQKISYAFDSVKDAYEYVRMR